MKTTIMKLTSLFITAIVLWCAGTAQADLKLHPLFTDDMVLQRERPVPIWGTARPGEKVTVSFIKQYESTRADDAGNWRITLKPMPGESAYRVLMVRTDKESILLKNLAVGDVYICSGQSNMEWPVAAAKDAQAEIAAANFPDIRLLTVPKKIAGTPQRDFAAPVRWQVCSPKTVPGFSAVGYFFGSELNQRLHIPIGLINSSWGGTIAQAWTSRDTLLKRDDLREQTLQTETAFAGLASLKERQAAWWQANDPGTKTDWSTPAFDDAAWATMKVPGAWENNGLANFDGTVWFRKTIDIPAAWEGKDLLLYLGIIDDRGTTFFNGVSVGSSDIFASQRDYKIPGAQVKAGRAVIAVRVLDTGGNGGFNSAVVPVLTLASDATQKIEVGGDWKYSVSAALKDLPAAPTDPSGNPNQPTVLFNGMIAPLVPFAVRGAIWYQGESNAGNPQQYRTLFPDLIRDWRTAWNAKQDGSEFGFYFVQLANYLPRVAEPMQAGWPELRQAQTMTLGVPRTGMATIIDIGEGADIHPKNKQDVGKRLALAALATEYGQPVENSGPMYERMEIIPGTKRVRIYFTHAKGLRVKPSIDEVNGKVPLDAWVYGAILNLDKERFLLSFKPFENLGKYPLTRTELALLTVKSLQHFWPGSVVDGTTTGPAGPPPSPAVESKEILERLLTEFRPEIDALGTKINPQLGITPENMNGLRPIPSYGLDVNGFGVQDADGKWHTANARLDGETIVVWSDQVFAPKAVAYAWTNNPDVNLVNAAGLPAVPFRTDAK